MADPIRAFPFFFDLSMTRSPMHFNFVFHNMINFGHFYFLQAQGVATNYPHATFSFAIPILLNFLVLKYQNQNKSPFETHPKTVFLGILSLLLYCVSYDYQQRLCLPHRSSVLNRIFHRSILFFGYMAMAILASLLFPASACPAIYALYVMVSVGDLLFLAYQRITRQLGTRFEVGRNSPFLITSNLVFLAAQRTSNRGHLLPMYSR